jgi:hypothetical protein
MESLLDRLPILPPAKPAPRLVVRDPVAEGLPAPVAPGTPPRVAAGGPLTVKLQPCGTATARLLDEQGRPVAKGGVSLTMVALPAIRDEADEVRVTITGVASPTHARREPGVRSRLDRLPNDCLRVRLRLPAPNLPPARRSPPGCRPGRRRMRHPNHDLRSSSVRRWSRSTIRRLTSIAPATGSRDRRGHFSGGRETRARMGRRIQPRDRTGGARRRFGHSIVRPSTNPATVAEDERAWQLRRTG